MRQVNSAARANATERNRVKPTLEVPIASIQVGQRVRKALGDIAGLADSLEDVGLLQPVAVTKDRGGYVLVAGHRRLIAAEKAGWKNIPVHVVDLDDVLLGEYHENAFRKNLLPTEMVELYRLIKDRLASPRGRPRKEGNFRLFPKGKTVDKVGKFCGVSGRTLQKMVEIVEAAEQNPEKYGSLAVRLDRTQRVEKIHNCLRRLKLTDMPVPKPCGKVLCGLVEEIVRTFENASFDAVIADPDWNLGLHYNGVHYPRIDPDEYWAGWLEPIYMEFLRILRPGGFLALFQPQAHYPYFGSWFSRDFRIYSSCSRFPSGWKTRSPLVSAHSPVIMQWKPGAKPVYPYPRKSSLDYFLSNGQYSSLAKLHPCPRPLDQMESLVENFVMPGARVLDAFAGAGTCSLACKRLGREFTAVEKDQDFCNLIERRLVEEV
jgi:SAM-dependent methyltransferase